MKKIKDKKFSNRTLLIVVLLIIATILGIIFCILDITKAVQNNMDVTAVSNKMMENTTIAKILSKFECTNVFYEVKCENSETYYNILVRFKHDLYEKNNSNKDYFDSIIKELGNYIDKSFKLVDEKKEIEIYYNIESKKYTINDVENYFDNNCVIEMENFKTISPTKSYPESEKLNLIINSGWSRDKLKLGDNPVSATNDWIDYGTYKINCSGRNINTVIFSKDYKDEVADDITVGMSFKEVEKILGTPNFKNSNIMIGYKTNKSYMFIYDDEIVVYPAADYSNYLLEELIVKYYTGNYDGYRTNFIVEVLDKYIDFTAEDIEDGIKISSYLRGIELYLYDDGKTEITVYNNYCFSNYLQRYAKDGKLKLNLEEDSVSLHEIYRNY